jgi:hypothetical protein
MSATSSSSVSDSEEEEETYADAKGKKYRVMTKFTEGDIALISSSYAFKTRKALLAAVR